MPPTDPLIYRFYELVQVYGTTWKELIQEEFGDGIMSAIDFDMTMERQPDQKGDRVKIGMSGKFLRLQDILSLPTRPDLQPRSVPDAPGRLQDDLQLAPLLVMAEVVARHARSETALRADRELGDVDEAARLLDAAQQRLHRLDLAGLGRDQAQHDDRRLAERALGHERSGSKPPARAVSYSSRRRSKRKVENSSSAMPS